MESMRTPEATSRRKWDLAELVVPLPGLLDQLDVPMAAIDTAGRVIWANQACVNVFGVPLDEIVGAALPFRHWPPDDVPRLLDLWRRLSSGELFASGQGQLDYLVVTPRGDRVPCELRHVPLADVGGRVQAHLCMLRPAGVGASAFDVYRTTQTRHAMLASLSPREREVVMLLIDGFRVPAIARRLFVSPHTVRNHLKGAYRRLHVTSQSELIERVRSADLNPSGE